MAEVQHGYVDHARNVVPPFAMTLARTIAEGLVQSGLFLFELLRDHEPRAKPELGSTPIPEIRG